jgi:hypothetical protein
MNRWDPLILVALAAVVAAVSDLAVRQRARGDSGAFWARVAARICLFAGLPVLLLTVVIPLLPPTVAEYLPATDRAWLLVVFSIWLVLIGIGLLAKDTPGAGRWLAASIGFTRRRYWVAGAIVLLLPALYSGLEAWAEPNHAANWALAVLLSTTLVFVALSTPSAQEAAAAPAAPETPADVPFTGSSEWLQAMQRARVEIETIRTIAPEPVRHASGAEQIWERQLAALGSTGITPEVLADVQRLVSTPRGESGRALSSLILGPDHAGQQEALALAGAALARGGEATLVITPSDPLPLVRSLRRWIPTNDVAPVRVEAVLPGSRTFESADIWIVEVSALSDYLLSYFKEDLEREDRSHVPLLRRVGLVAWWDTHRYSGVRAGNVWAISRRLSRMVDAYGKSQVRALMFARLPVHAIAQTSAFVEHLLPYPISRETETRIQARPARAMQIHRSKTPAPALATASVRHGFSTAMDGIEPAEIEALLGIEQVDGKPLREQLRADPSDADVRLLNLLPSDVLAVPELVVTGGRSGNLQSPHHVVLLPPDNPYVDFVLGKYRAEGATGSSCYLVGAQGRSELIQRHVEHALREKRDTLAGLVSVFRWDRSMLADTLSDLSSRGQLHRTAVRYLDEEKRLKRDFVYSSLAPQGLEGRPLETVGMDLVEVRDPAVAGPEGLHLRVDRERVAIDAYPGRVFVHAGRRYRIKNWSNASALERIDCTPEDLDVETWRARNARLRRIVRQSPQMQTHGLRRFAVSADYREELTAVIERQGQGAFRPVSLAQPEYSEFSTRALVLSPNVAADSDALYVLAMVLRHVLPVHVGVEESCLEVVRLANAQVEGEGRVSGLAIVDLLPGGGIGLIDAIQESDALVHSLISSCWSWLSAAARQRDSAESLFNSSPIAAATGGVVGLRLSPTVELLSTLIADAARRG